MRRKHARSKILLINLKMLLISICIFSYTAVFVFKFCALILIIFQLIEFVNCYELLLLLALEVLHCLRDMISKQMFNL